MMIASGTFRNVDREAEIAGFVRQGSQDAA